MQLNIHVFNTLINKYLMCSTNMEENKQCRSRKEMMKLFIWRKRRKFKKSFFFPLREVGIKKEETEA